MYEEVDDQELADVFFATKKEHDVMLARCERLFLAAESWRKAKEDRWKRWYKLSQSHAERVQGQWGSIVFVPKIFTIVETIKSRMMAQLPEPVVIPVGAEDEAGAPHMEELLRWSAEQSGLYLQLISAIDSALRYGTGILKITPMKKAYTRTRKQTPEQAMPVPTPLIDPETQQPLTDPNGQPVMDTPVAEKPRSSTTEEEYVSYVGPCAEALDLQNVYVDPMATCFEDATYVIHRMFKSREWVRARIDSGFFHKPQFMPDEAFDAMFVIPEEDPSQMRQSSVGMGGGLTEPDRIEIRECWYADGTVVYDLNRKVVVRVVKTPFDHGEFPFVRIVDHLMPHEFYGVGEIQHLEGPQDLVNALTNQRVDNVRLKLETVFYGDARAIENREDLQVYPGAYIKVNNPNDQPLDQVFRQLDMGDVTASSFNEVDFWSNQMDATSAVTDYQTGGDNPNLNDTATGVALISEQGNTRFSMKLKMAELTGLQALYRQYGALIQQFMPDDFVIRIMGPQGVEFKQVEPAAIYGAFDYEIESGSSAQTETIRRQQAMELFNTALAAYKNPMLGQPVFDLDAMGEDLLRTYDKKDIPHYMAPLPPPPQPGPPVGPVPPGAEQGMMDQSNGNGQVPEMAPPGPMPPGAG